MNRQQLINEIFTKKTFLCVGLDTDINKIPAHLKNEDDPIFAFNKAIIDATAPYCVAYKPNLAFYECYGLKGMLAFEKTIQYIKENHPNHFIIADAKRGDIGNTSKMYAQTFFEEYNLDSVTVAPYMGEDSVKPFLEYKASDTAFQEELVAKKEALKKSILDWFSLESAYRLSSELPQDIKRALMERINKQLVLGSIHNIYFEEFVILY